MERIIVAVSGGADSMALLHMLTIKGYEIIVVHVNYQVRESAKRDQKIVENFCQKHNLTLKILYAKEAVGNFQAFARRLRYDYMQEIAKEYDAYDVYVAHHLDDVIETYLMQKERKSIPEFYGIKSELNYETITLKRPLLHLSKEEIIEYCRNNSIDYGDDESNFKNDYTRNRIRNTVVSKMSKMDKQDLINEIKKLNSNLESEAKVLTDIVDEFKKDFSLKKLLAHKDEIIIKVMRLYLKEYNIYTLTDDEYENLILFLKSSGNGQYDVSKKYLIDKSYGCLTIVEKNNLQYSYTFNEIVEFKCEFFEIKLSGRSTEAVTLSESDFPITIRNFEDGDKIQMQYGSKAVNRFFIDRKIPLYQRPSWPIVLNASNEVILVPRLGCNLTHYSNIPTMFVVK